VRLFAGLPTAKASFATKYVNRDLLTLDPRGRTRVRFSLMPHAAPGAKAGYVGELTALVERVLPGCRVRYAF
jgi:hypothetical protein